MDDGRAGRGTAGAGRLCGPPLLRHEPSLGTVPLFFGGGWRTRQPPEQPTRGGPGRSPRCGQPLHGISCDGPATSCGLEQRAGMQPTLVARKSRPASQMESHATVTQHCVIWSREPRCRPHLAARPLGWNPLPPSCDTVRSRAESGDVVHAGGQEELACLSNGIPRDCHATLCDLEPRAGMQSTLAARKRWPASRLDSRTTVM